MYKFWTIKEETYLQDRWGEISIPSIAKKLDKSINAIKLKAQRLGLGRHLHSGKEITFSQLMAALGKQNNYSSCKYSWQKHGCSIKYKKTITKKYAVINIDEFWDWAEKNKNLLDLSNFELNTLGKEPSWVKEKRKADILMRNYKTTPWTKGEDDYLISLLNKFEYGYREISEKLCRTEGAIKRRIMYLGLKMRPVRMPNHNPWEAHNVEKTMIMYSQGYSPEIISGQVGRSASAVRGLIERLTERGGQA